MPHLFFHRRTSSPRATLFAIGTLVLCAWLAALSLASGQRLEQGLWLNQADGFGLSEHAGDRAPPDELLSARTAVVKRRVEPFHLQLPGSVAVLAVVLWFSIFALQRPASVPRVSPGTSTPPPRHPRLRRSGVSRAPPRHFLVPPILRPANPSFATVLRSCGAVFRLCLVCHPFPGAFLRSEIAAPDPAHSRAGRTLEINWGFK